LRDEELILAFERGDRELTGRLYDRLINVVSATLIRVMGSRGQDHDDLVQSAFEQIVITLVRRRFAGACSLSSWAATVTTHVALNALRSRVRERRVIDRKIEIDAFTATVSSDMERSTDQRALLHRLREELSRMDQSKATVLVLHDVLGHELAEIAVLTAVSVSAAQSRLVRGRRELEARMADALEGGL
jgi:RNA polymerase sigma-70 factor (ECF subfamily)